MKVLNRMFIVVILISVLSIPHLSAQLNENEVEYHLLYKEANEAFAAESPDYETALGKYLIILKKRGPSTNLLGNIANCYFKLNKWGQARLYLEKALISDPHNPDILNNHRVVMDSLSFETKPDPKLIQVVKSISSNTYFILSWIIVAIPGIWLLYLILLRRMPFSVVKEKSFYFSGLFLLSIAGILLWLSSIAAENTSYGIVVSEKSVLRQSPFDTAEEQFSVLEGEKLKVIDTHENFYLCLTSDKKGKGWINNSDFMTIIPR